MLKRKEKLVVWTREEHQKRAQGYFNDALQADALGERDQADVLLASAIYHEREAQAQAA